MSDQPGLSDLEDTEGNKEQQEKETNTRQPDNPFTSLKTSKALSAWQEYYDGLGAGRQKEIEELSKKLQYEITLQPLYDDNGNLTEGDKIKVYKRRKISTKDFFETERMRGQIRKSKDPEETTQLLIHLYQKLAWFYLEDEQGKRMTEEDFMRCDWVPIKNILDGANLNSVVGKLPLEAQK